MALAGPLVSFVLGFLFLGVAHTMGWVGPSHPTATPLVAMLGWLGYINFSLGLFNLVPAYPLDGGRVLRAAAWWGTQSMERATNIAAAVGQVFAFLFIFAGLWQFFTGHSFGGLWIAFIGWFLLDAARSSRMQVEIMHALGGVKVREVMERNCTVVDAHTSLQSLVEEHLLRTGQRCFIVQKDGRLVGLLTPADVARIERQLWPMTAVEEAMRPLKQLRVVSPDAPVMQALETMAQENINQLPVTSDGRLEGIISRAHLLEILRTRAELKV